MPDLWLTPMGVQWDRRCCYPTWHYWLQPLGPWFKGSKIWYLGGGCQPLTIVSQYNLTALSLFGQRHQNNAQDHGSVEQCTRSWHQNNVQGHGNGNVEEHGKKQKIESNIPCILRTFLNLGCAQITHAYTKYNC
jgi:hypothetical protein